MVSAGRRGTDTWFERVGYGADIAALDAELGPMTRLDNWAGKTLSA